MVNYSLGKVYKIVGNGKIYVGSTCKRLLCQRLAGHNGNYKSYQNGKGNNVTSFQCLSDPNHYIELLELCPCNSKDELHKCERKYIEQLDCVNRIVIGRTPKEYYLVFYEANKEEIKEYRNTHKEDKKKMNKSYRNTHKEEMKQYNKQRYLKRKQLKQLNQ